MDIKRKVKIKKRIEKELPKESQEEKQFPVQVTNKTQENECSTEKVQTTSEQPHKKIRIKVKKQIEIKVDNSDEASFFKIESDNLKFLKTQTKDPIKLSQRQIIGPLNRFLDTHKLKQKKNNFIPNICTKTLDDTRKQKEKDLQKEESQFQSLQKIIVQVKQSQEKEEQIFQK